jgi:DNA repair protein RecO
MNFEPITGFIFRLYDAKEADKVVHLLNTEGKKMTLYARGVKKPKSRKAYAIDLLNHVKVKLERAQGEMLPISEIQLIQQPRRLVQDYQGILCLQTVCEIISIFATEEVDEPALYKNVENILSVKEIRSYDLLLVQMIFRFLYVAGMLPKLQLDVGTGENLNDAADVFFSDMRVGFSNSRQTGDTVAPPRLLKSLRFLLVYDFNAGQKLGLEKDEVDQLLQLAQTWLFLATQQELRTLRQAQGN